MSKGAWKLALMGAVSSLTIIGTLNGQTGTSPDRTLTLKYHIGVGDVYSYRIIIDQNVVNNRAARLHTRFDMNVIDSDGNADPICRLHVLADTSKFEGDVSGAKSTYVVAGNRLFTEAGMFESIIDAMGRMISGKSILEERDKGMETSSAAGNELNRMTVSSRDAAELNMVVKPTIPYPKQAVIQEKYFDTAQVTSRFQSISTLSPGESNSDRKLNVDTIYRTTMLDSVVIADQREVAYFTVRSERHTFTRTTYVSEASIRRDVGTGLVTDISEHAYRVDSEKRVPYYSAHAMLVVERSTPFRANGTGTFYGR